MSRLESHASRLVSSKMAWAVGPYRAILEAYCLHFKSASKSQRAQVLEEVIQELKHVEAREGGVKKFLPEGLDKVFLLHLRYQMEALIFLQT